MDGKVYFPAHNFFTAILFTLGKRPFLPSADDSVIC